MSRRKEVFISYPRENRHEAKQVYNLLVQWKADPILDEFDLPYMGNIKEFMKRVSGVDYVIVLLCHEFLYSQHCMSEMMFLLESGRTDHHLIPVLLDSFNVEDQSKIMGLINYWHDQHKKIEQESRGLDEEASEGYVKEHREQFGNISKNIGKFISTILKRRYWRFEEVVNDNLQSIANYMGLSDNQEAGRDRGSLEEAEWPNDDLKPVDQHFNAGYKAHLDGDFDQAKLHYLEANRLNPKLPNVHYNLALIYDMEGDVVTAIRHLKFTIQLNPGFADAYLQYGIMLVKKAQWDEALKKLMHSIRLSPGLERGYIHLGALLIRLERQEEAIRHYHDAHKNFLEKSEFLIATAYVTGNLTEEVLGLSAYRTYFESFNQLTTTWRDPDQVAGIPQQPSDGTRIIPAMFGSHGLGKRILEPELMYNRIMKVYHAFFAIKGMGFMILKAPLDGDFSVSRTHISSYVYQGDWFAKTSPIDGTDELNIVQSGSHIKPDQVYGYLGHSGKVHELKFLRAGIFLGFLALHEQSVSKDQPLAVVKLL